MVVRALVAHDWPQPARKLNEGDLLRHWFLHCSRGEEPTAKAVRADAETAARWLAGGGRQQFAPGLCRRPGLLLFWSKGCMAAAPAELLLPGGSRNGIRSPWVSDPAEGPFIKKRSLRFYTTSSGARSSIRSFRQYMPGRMLKTMHRKQTSSCRCMATADLEHCSGLTSGAARETYHIAFIGNVTGCGKRNVFVEERACISCN